MSALVEDSSGRSDDIQASEVSKADVLTKEASVAVGEESQTNSTNEAEGNRSAKSQSENDTVYVNGHPVIENGMTIVLFYSRFSFLALIH